MYKRKHVHLPRKKVTHPFPLILILSFLLRIPPLVLSLSSRMHEQFIAITYIYLNVASSVDHTCIVFSVHNPLLLSLYIPAIVVLFLNRTHWAYGCMDFTIIIMVQIPWIILTLLDHSFIQGFFYIYFRWCWKHWVVL